MMKVTILFSLFNIIFLTTQAQITGNGNQTIVGNKCPDFQTEVEYFGNRAIVSLDDFKGKWLLLDFWGENCSGCIASFPKMNELQREYSQQLQIVLVGIPWKEKKMIRSLYERCREEKNLNLPIAYDSELAKLFNVNNTPDIIIIDPRGIVKARTSEIDKKSIEELLSGKMPNLKISSKEYRERIATHDFRKALLIDNNGGRDSDYVYRSIFSPWNSQTRIGQFDFPGRFEVLGVPLAELYRLAYFGKEFWTMTDDSLYKTHNYTLSISIKNSPWFQSTEGIPAPRISYSNSYPITHTDSTYMNWDISNPKIRSRLKNDLSNLTNFNASVRETDVNCLKLVATENTHKLLKTKGGTSSDSKQNSNKHGVYIKNLPIKHILYKIYTSVGFDPSIPIFDSTGIEKNIDINLRSVYYQDLKKELNQYGLSIVPTKRKMLTIFIEEKTKTE